MKNIVVVGGANIDIVAFPDGELRAHDSAPGHSSVTFGGVGRNIAENLVMMGCRVRFVTVFGNDSFSRTMKADIMDKGIDISLSRTIHGAPCSKYICLNSHEGELVAAINDMSVYDHMGEAINAESIAAMNEADMVVLDANTTAPDLERIVSACTTPIAFDAVSLSKVSRCSSILNRIFLFKPNIYEAEELLKEELAASGSTELSLRERAGLYAGLLRKKGVENVMISMGADGVYYENESESGIMPSMVTKVVNTSGCGDAFLAGAIRAHLEGGSINTMARYGSAAAAICAESDTTVSRRISMERLNAIVNR